MKMKFHGNDGFISISVASLSAVCGGARAATGSSGVVGGGFRSSGIQVEAAPDRWPAPAAEPIWRDTIPDFTASPTDWESTSKIELAEGSQPHERVDPADDE
jgi:hypothetical protein